MKENRDYKKRNQTIGCMAGILLCFLLTACAKKKEDSINLMIPSGLQVTYQDQSMQLTWDAADNAEGYHVYRSASRYGVYEKITAEPVLGTAYQDRTETWYYYKVASAANEQESGLSKEHSYEMVVLGENTYVFSPEDDPAKVMQKTAEIFRSQERNQFGDARYAYLFKPGSYDQAIHPKIGYYTHAAGLSLLPEDTVLAGLTCDARWLGGNSNHNATCNFWRGAENLTIDSDVMWAVSQAVFLRRVKINGSLALHDNRGWSSGGFLSDSLITGTVDSGSQQQWLSRNCSWGRWSGQNWNMVFMGLSEGCAPVGSWPEDRYTVIDKTPAVREKPFLFYDPENHYQIFVPALRRDSTGITWDQELEGRILPFDSIYFAVPGDTAEEVNQALADGKHILFTPGIYTFDQTIAVTKPDTVVMGIGLATLRGTDGRLIMEIADVDGITVCGLLFDAGTTHTESLLRVGSTKTNTSHFANPICLSDLFFRVGGVFREAVSTENCVVINSADVIGDNFWVWRADHGDGVAWNKNYAKNGIIVEGDGVWMYALMVEHFQEYQTIWNGEGGRTYFYQSEIPYDVPNQESWMNGEVNGFASYKVGDLVQDHAAYGLGIYSYHRDAKVDLHSAMEVPDSANVSVTNVCAIMITGNPGISHVVNDRGKASVTPGFIADILWYCNGEVVE